MEFFVLIACFAASALAFPKVQIQDELLHGIATPEQMRDMLAERIIQGWPAVNGQFPHQAFLITTGTNGIRYVCGGSLISTRWVVTAAHCAYQRVEVEVYLGDVAYASSPINITSRNMYVYPGYNSAYLYNDIALIDLGQDVPTSANVKPIRIVNSKSDSHAGKVALVSGFGQTSNSGSVSRTLNYVNLTIITNDKCEDTFGPIILSSTICGNGILSEVQGACNGDSGGPLILRGSTEDTLIGIVSFGSSKGCTAGDPSAFVRPNYFIDWLNDVTGIEFTS